MSKITKKDLMPFKEFHEAGSPREEANLIHIQVRVSVSENNSGGHYRVNEHGWGLLRQMGWEVDERHHHYTKAFTMAVYGCDVGVRANEYSNTAAEDMAYDAAYEEFEDLTGRSFHETGCECCGRPFRVKVAEITGSEED